MNTSSGMESEGLSHASRRRLEDAIEIASRMAGTDAVCAMHITVLERPTYDELRLFQQIAACHGLILTMTADSIIVRPKPIDPQLAEAATALGVAAHFPSLGRFASGTWHRVHDRVSASSQTHGVRAGMHWLHDHAAHWNAAFQDLSEGTR
jgi:hypothetical protein